MTQPLPTDDWPLPALTITTELKITSLSAEAERLFGQADAFLNLLDEESRQKAEKLLQPESQHTAFELNFLSAEGSLFLADVHSKWTNGSAAVVIVPKDGSMAYVREQLETLRGRLQETNMDLLYQKERSEELLKRVQELSAPCIRLDCERVLIPLFGDLTHDKLATVQPSVLTNIYSDRTKTAIIDFTAVDQIASDSVSELDSLFQAIAVMGIEVLVTGLHPDHAKRLHELEARFSTTFAASLKDVLV